MEKLTALLEEHRLDIDSSDSVIFGCDCMWGWQKILVTLDEYQAHLAEMLKPLLAEVYAEAFSDGYDLAADDIGAWQCNLDHCADSGDNADGYTNPYEKETE